MPNPNLYGANRKIEGYVQSTKVARPLAFKQFFGDVNTTWADQVSMDIEANDINVMGQFADPDVEVFRIQTPGMGTQDLSFGYSKEFVGSPNYSEISQRMLAEQPGAVTLDKARLARAYAENMQWQFRKAYERFENLYELTRAKILLNGKLTTSAITNAGQHREVTWDMGRTRLTNTTNTQAQRNQNYDSVIGKNGDVVPEVDLTTLQANTNDTTAGGMSWDQLSSAGAAIADANLTKGKVSPVGHVKRMLSIAARRAGTDAIFMSADAYSWFIADLMTNYKDAANTLYDRSPNSTIMLDILPYVKENTGLEFRMMFRSTRGDIPIYTYDGFYVDRVTGQRENFMPNGYVLLVPPREYGAHRFGKIQHLKAMWAAQQFWVNSWTNERTGVEAFEIHTNFATYHTDIDSVVSWKVCSTGNDKYVAY